jgi:hypothetical protein
VKDASTHTGRGEGGDRKARREVECIGEGRAEVNRHAASGSRAERPLCIWGRLCDNRCERTDWCSGKREGGACDRTASQGQVRIDKSSECSL